MMIFSPFEQFEITLLYPIFIWGYDFSLTSITLYLFLVFSTIIGTMYLSTRSMMVLPHSLQSAAEIVYTFVFDLVSNQTSGKGVRYFPAIFTAFSFILTMNVFGLIPMTMVLTGQIIIIFILAASYYIGCIIIGFRTLGLDYLKIFVPKGLPTWLLPIIIVIEIFSFLIRPISLSVRIFANMLAGHVLVYILASATITLSQISFLYGIFPFLALLAFTTLEIGVALIQAYVFTVLITIYLSEALEGH